jgi:hypothetical protein
MTPNMPTVTAGVLQYQQQGHQQLVPVSTPEWTAGAFQSNTSAGSSCFDLAHKLLFLLRCHW